MSHLDEGTLHALLDGELELTEVKEIQAHLGSCAACGSRLREVREFLAESDRLVSSVQFPGELRRPQEAAAAAAPAAPAAALRNRVRSARAEPDTTPPVLLFPDNPDFDVRPGRWLTMAKWAAVLAVVAGAGFLVSPLRQNPGAEFAASQSERVTPSLDTSPIVSQEETTQKPESLAKAAVPEQRPVAAASAPAPARVARDKAAPPDSVASSKVAAPEQELAIRADQLEEPKDAGAELANEDSITAASAQDEAYNQTAAQAAMAELDRRRRLERARNATALLDAQQRQREAAARAAVEAPAPAPPLAPRTLEQRSQVYLRIGLDEAARQLGRPVHVIEGMSPAFMGLAQGRISPGADENRPVVRVVYQDSQGRMIVLDQQRIRPGQTVPQGNGGWIYGDIHLSLFGEVGPEVLKNLRPRVR